MSLLEPRADFLQRFGGKRHFHRDLVSANLGLQLTREGNRVHDTGLFEKSGQDTFAYGPGERRRNAIGGEGRSALLYRSKYSLFRRSKSRLHG
jgi:hypothetical protein